MSSWDLYLNSMGQFSHEALSELVIAGDPMQYKVWHVGGAVASKQRPTKIGNAGLCIVFHEF